MIIYAKEVNQDNNHLYFSQQLNKSLDWLVLALDLCEIATCTRIGHCAHSWIETTELEMIMIYMYFITGRFRISDIATEKKTPNVCLWQNIEELGGNKNVSYWPL